MAAVEKEETKLSLPWDIIEAGKGISMDIGGSVIKIVYLHKDDWKEPTAREQSDKGCLRLVSYSREEMDAAFKYTNENIHIIRGTPEEEVTVSTTGIGVSQLHKTIRSAFNIHNNNIGEGDCFAKSFYYLMKNIPRKDLLIEVCEPAFEYARQHVNRYYNMMKKMESVSSIDRTVDQVNGAPQVKYPAGSIENLNKPMSEEPGVFPCVLFACGSAFGGLKIKEDGTFSISAVSNRGGRTFCGLGSLLTGCKTFDELMVLCEKGNAGKVGSTNIHLTQNLNTDEDNMYTASKDEDMDETIVYYFGQAVGQNSDSFKKEDKARCLLEMVVQDLVQVAHSACVSGKIKNVFFCGSFVNHPLVRQLITKNWLYRDVLLSMFMTHGESSDQIGLHFLQQGSHLGALGAYLNSTLQFIKVTDTFETEETKAKEVK